MAKAKKPHKIVIISGEHRHEIDTTKSGRVTIFRLGDPDRGILPDAETFDAFVKLLKQASQNPDFVIIWNYALQIDQVEL